jgi:hypothetical protein
MTESSAWVEGIYPGYRTKTIKIGNATVEINRPILSPEEQAKREEQVKDALRGFIRKG